VAPAGLSRPLVAPGRRSPRAYDERILAWLAGWDVPTVGAVVSLLHRARAARPIAGAR
jgi:hypothetical protein